MFGAVGVYAYCAEETSKFIGIISVIGLLLGNGILWQLIKKSNILK